MRVRKRCKHLAEFVLEKVLGLLGASDTNLFKIIGFKRSRHVGDLWEGGRACSLGGFVQIGNPKTYQLRFICS